MKEQPTDMGEDAATSYALAMDALHSPRFDETRVSDQLEVIMYAALSVAESLLHAAGTPKPRTTMRKPT